MPIFTIKGADLKMYHVYMFKFAPFTMMHLIAVIEGPNFITPQGVFLYFRIKPVTNS